MWMPMLSPISSMKLTSSNDDLRLVLDQLAMAAVEDRREGRHAGRGGGAEFALAQLGLELRQYREWLACVLTHRHVELDHFEPGDRAEYLFDRRHDAGQRRALLQRDPLVDRMDEQLPQIVEAFGEELGDRVHVERHRAERFAYAGIATSPIWIWQLGHHAMTRDAPGRRQPLDRVERRPVPRSWRRPA